MATKTYRVNWEFAHNDKTYDAGTEADFAESEVGHLVGGVLSEVENVETEKPKPRASRKKADDSE